MRENVCTLTDTRYPAYIPAANPVSAYSRNADILPGERDKLLAAIGYLSEIENGWDGRDAIKPTPLSVTRSAEFIKKLWGKIYPDTVSPDGEGGINFKWKTASHSIIITVDSGFLHLSRVNRQKNIDADIFLDNILFDGELIPQSIMEQIPQRDRNTQTK